MRLSIILPAITMGCAAPTLAADGKDPRTYLELMRARELGHREIAESNENDICIQEEDDFFDCLYQEPTCLQANNCRMCLANEMDKIVEWDVCYNVNDVMCEALAKCDCGPCSNRFETWFDCIFDYATFGCQFNCDAYRKRGLRVFPNIDMVPDDDTREDSSCAIQEDDFGDCVYQELTCVQKENCNSCIASKGIDKIEEWGACYDINDTLCKAIKECDCGTCRDMAESLFDCIVDENSHGCQVQCKDDIPLIETRTIGEDESSDDPMPRDGPRASAATNTNTVFAFTITVASLACTFV